MVVVNVHGSPAPKGSSRAIVKNGHAVNVPSGSDANRDRQRTWHSAICDAIATLEPEGYRPGSPLACSVVFRFPMRKTDIGSRGVKSKAPIHVTVKPDIDKLLRSTFDSITSSGLWADDAQVAKCSAARVYVPPGYWTGAVLIVGGALEFAEVALKFDQEVAELHMAMLAAKEMAQ